MISDPFYELAGADQFFIDQKSNIMEGCCKSCSCWCFDVTNRYDVLLPQGVRYQAREHSSRCDRCLCNPNHALKLGIKSWDGHTEGKDIMLSIERPFKCCCPAVAPCCRKEITVSRNVGNDTSKVIGYVRQPCFGGCFKPKLDMFTNEGGEDLGSISGPCCCLGGCLGGHKFQVLNKFGTEIGIVNHLGIVGNGIGRTLFTDADRYQIDFKNKNENIDMKLNVLSSVLMLDYMFFEGETACACNWCWCPPCKCNKVCILTFICMYPLDCSFKCCDWYCCGLTLPMRCRIFVPEEEIAKAASGGKL